MKGICKFCGNEKDLSNHEIIARSYGGTREDATNIYPDPLRRKGTIKCKNL